MLKKKEMHKSNTSYKYKMADVAQNHGRSKQTEHEKQVLPKRDRK